MPEGRTIRSAARKKGEYNYNIKEVWQEPRSHDLQTFFAGRGRTGRAKKNKKYASASGKGSTLVFGVEGGKNRDEKNGLTRNGCP